MTEAIYILFRLLLLMIVLVMIGEPLRAALSKYLRLFKQLDFLQIGVLNVYLGGLVLYFIAILPLHLFNAHTVSLITTISGVFSIFLHRGTLKKLINIIRLVRKGVITLHGYLSGGAITILEFSAVLGMFFATLYIQVIPLSDFIFGSIHDLSLHSLFVQVMLENQGVPVTMQPYLDEGVLYPQAAHVFFAYGCLVFGYIPPEAIFHITALFQALVILGAYYLGKSLSSRHLGVSLVFIFFCVSRWPRLIAWGTNPYVVSFPLQFISLSFFPFLQGLHAEYSTWEKRLSIFVIGILLGYLAAIHLTQYIIVIAAIAVSAFVSVIHKRRFYELQNMLTVCIISIIPIGLFIYRFFQWYPNVGHNIGLPTDVIITPWIYTNVFNWLIFSEGITPYPPLLLIILGLVFFSFVIIYKKRRQLAVLLDITKVSLCLLLAALILVLLFHLQYVFPSFSLIAGEVVRPTISLYISLCFFVGIFNCILYDALVTSIRKILGSILLPSKQTFKNVMAIIFAFLALFCIYLPFLYYTITQDANYLVENYGKFSVTTLDDYELMLWMRGNLPEHSVVLVSIYEPGMFIPSISHFKVLYPWVLSKDNPRYLTLMKLIRNGTLNPAVYELMAQFGITHVYVGARSSLGTWPLDMEVNENRKWDPLAFLSNPSFNLIKKVGDAYLFEVLYENPEIVYKDGFEYANISDMGWKLISAEGYQFKGYGCVSTNSSCTYNGTRKLVISAKNEGGLLYTIGIYRKIYVWNTSNVTLSFYINATEGFSLHDALSISIYDTSRNRSICFTTPNLSYLSYNSTIVLPTDAGFFSYDISEIWQKTYNETLPATFFIAIQNVDFDGVENVCYVDDVMVSVKNSGS